MSANRSEKGPSAAGVFIAALFMFLTGGVLGFVYLASIPPARYAGPYEYERATKDKEERPPRPGDAHCYWAPSPYGIRTWQAKRDKLLEGRNTSVTFSLSELNAWWASEFAALRFEESEKDAALRVLPDAPFFAVDEAGILHISSPLRVDVYGNELEVMLTVRGTFDNSGDEGPRFVVAEMLFNSAPIPRAGSFAARLFSRAGQKAFAAEEFTPYREAFSRISKVDVAEASVRFVLQ